jgi:hypothetical protein
MSGEPQPPDGKDKLDQALFGLWFVWFGLLSGGIMMGGVLSGVVVFLGQPLMDLGELNYLFLVFVPFGLFGAYVVAPKLGGKNPAEVVRAANKSGQGGAFKNWEGTPRDDPYYWFPCYSTQFFMRLGALEGSSIVILVGFLMTGNWIVLVGAVVLLAALVVEQPTRSSYVSWAEEARLRLSEEPGTTST